VGTQVRRKYSTGTVGKAIKTSVNIKNFLVTLDQVRQQLIRPSSQKEGMRPVRARRNLI
jgi:hypothetical protein